MNNYEKLRQLLCEEEEEIRNQIDEMRMTSDEGYDVIVQDEQELELRHILWYCHKKIIYISFYRDKVNIKGKDKKDIFLTIKYKLPLSSQDEVCEKIYNYLITL